MKIYIVTTGSYSDYGIERVFLNKAKAEDFAKCLREHGDCWKEDANVEEYDTFDDKFDCNCVWVEVYYWRNTNEARCEIVAVNDDNEVGSDLNYICMHFKQSDKEVNKDKYIKIMQDKYAELKSLIENEGYTIEMINELINKVE